MKLGYNQFPTHEAGIEFVEDSFRKLGEAIPDWIKQEGLRLYGYFYDENDPSDRMRQIYVFGRTILRSSLENKGVGIFSQLKQYGSSIKYKGLIDIFGKELIPNEYERFTPFLTIENDGHTLLIAEKYGKKGLVGIHMSSGSGWKITPVKYDDFFYANEYTLGFVTEGKVGFMSLSGSIVIDAKFINKEGYNTFSESKALVQLDDKNSVPCYINHYGDILEYYEDDIYYSPTFGNGTGYYPFGDLPSASEAYEGDSSNYWNND